MKPAIDWALAEAERFIGHMNPALISPLACLLLRARATEIEQEKRYLFTQVRALELRMAAEQIEKNGPFVHFGPVTITPTPPIERPEA